MLHVVEAIAHLGTPQAPTAYVSKREDQVAQTLRAAGFKVDTVVAEGDVRMEIIDAGQVWGADLIVVGSHGRKGLGHSLMGSVSEAVAHHAGCSVEIVRIQSKR